MTTADDPVAEILQSIATFYSLPLPGESSLACNGQGERLSEIIKDELGVTVTADELESCSSVTGLSRLIKSRLIKTAFGKTLTDIYREVERMAREEYHPKIPYHWCAPWEDFINVGNWFTRPDGLDAVEMVIRMEEEYRIRISDEDAAAMETVGQTIRYLWTKSGGNWGLQLSQKN